MTIFFVDFEKSVHFLAKFLNSNYPVTIRVHTKCGPDRFSRFDVYRLQTNNIDTQMIRNFVQKKVILGLNAKLLPHENLLFRGNHNLFWVFYVSVFHFVFCFFVTFYFVTVCNLVTLLLCIFFTFSIITSSLVTLKLFNLVQLSLLFRHTKKKCFCFYLCIL